MTFNLVDLSTKEVIDTFGSKEAADKALSRLYNEPGTQRYEIRQPIQERTKKPSAKKQSNWRSVQRIT